jgi:flagellar protein FliO/FliZ
VHALLAAVASLSLLQAVPPPAASAAPGGAPAPGAAPAQATAPASPLAGADLHLPRAGVDLSAAAAPALLLAGLGAAAFLLARRRRAPGRRVMVLETTALGPKRSLVLAQLEGEVLLLGSSEAGIQLLKTCPADELAEAPAAPRLAAAPARRAGPPAALKGLVARLRGARPAPRPLADFDDLLAESSEDQDLRAKLARGQAGSVR